MNTATTRIRAGAPALQLHRAQPIDFVMNDEEEQAVRSGFDQAMKEPISRPHIPQPKRDSDYLNESSGVAWMGYLLIACALCVIFAGSGYIAGRYFS